MLLQAENITKSFGTKQILKGINLELTQGNTLSVLGKSGCGKTTLLKIIAGLERADNGSLSLNDRDILKISAEKRGIVYLYQEDLLFPHLNVYENIAFGLRIKKTAEKIIRNEVHEMLKQLEIEDQASKMPHELSGGQRQRVSFGRAIIINPKILLLDEPFGSLDSITRTNMQQLFKRLTAKFSISSVFVTHDLKEALLIGNQIALMKKGELHIYQSKEDFINDPETGVAKELNFWKNLNQVETESIEKKYDNE